MLFVLLSLRVPSFDNIKLLRRLRRLLNDNKKNNDDDDDDDNYVSTKWLFICYMYVAVNFFLFQLICVFSLSKIISINYHTQKQ